MNATTISALIGTILSAALGLFGIRQWYLHRGDETTKDREGREDRERESRDSRYDAGVWRIVDELRAEVVSLKGRVESLEAQNRVVVLENIELRAEKLQMKGVIDQLTARVGQLERHETGGQGQ